MEQVGVISTVYRHEFNKSTLQKTIEKPIDVTVEIKRIVLDILYKVQRKGKHLERILSALSEEIAPIPGNCNYSQQYTLFVIFLNTAELKSKSGSKKRKTTTTTVEEEEIESVDTVELEAKLNSKVIHTGR